MRATLDKLISALGLLLALVLLIAGGLLWWANAFVGDQVEQQFSDQHITMPTDEAIDGDEALSDEDKDALKPFAGDKLDNGDAARAYADHYILAHMNHSSDDRTYSEVSGEFMGKCSDPAEADSAECQELGGLRQSLFMGNTLRGLLLYGFAFATLGTIAGYAAIAAFIGAIALLILSFLGFSHAKKVNAEPAATA